MFDFARIGQFLQYFLAPWIVLDYENGTQLIQALKFKVKQKKNEDKYLIKYFLVFDFVLCQIWLYII